MIISGYHFQQKSQIDDKISKIDDKMMIKKPLFNKKGWGNMISQSCDKIFKYQDVKELQIRRVGKVGNWGAFDSPIYIL